MKLSIIRGVRLVRQVKTDDTSNKSSEQSSVNCSEKRGKCTNAIQTSKQTKRKLKLFVLKQQKNRSLSKTTF